MDEKKYSINIHWSKKNKCYMASVPIPEFYGISFPVGNTWEEALDNTKITLKSLIEWQQNSQQG